MPNREKVIEGLQEIVDDKWMKVHADWYVSVCADALALLKEQDEQKRRWLRNIADNQLAHAPKDSHEFMSLDEHLENEYKRGVWDGLQMAYEILTEET